MKQQFKDKTPSSDAEAINIISTYFSSKKKFISQIYTKNNFDILKRKYPLLWSYLAGKKLNSISFAERTSKTITINGKPFVIRFCQTSNVWKIIENYEFPIETNIGECIKMLEFFAKSNLIGFDILKFVKKFYKKFYQNYVKQFEDSNSNREIIYRAIHDLKIRPNINGIPLKFTTYSLGYLSKNLYDEYNKLQDKSEHNILKLFVENLKYEKKATTHLKYFFHELFCKINNKYENCKYFATKLLLYYNGLTELPSCKFCGKHIKETNKFQMYNFCSNICSRKYAAKLHTEHLESIYGTNWKTEWINYKTLVERYTEISYKKFTNIINPQRLNTKT